MSEIDFVPYKESLRLKKIGFEDSCLGCYDEKGIGGLTVMSTRKYYSNSKKDTWNCAMPLYQQAFDFLLGKVDFNYSIDQHSGGWALYFNECDHERWIVSDVDKRDKLHTLRALLDLCEQLKVDNENTI